MARKFQKLTRPNIRALRRGGKITEHAITAERLTDSDVRYSVNVMVDGERVHRTIGRESEGVTRTQAEDFIVQVRADSKSGRLNLPKGRKTHLSFTEAADRYVAMLEETTGKNIVAKRRQLSLYLKPFFGSQRLDRISEFTVGRYKRQRVERGASNGTINRELATLSHLLSRAVTWKWLNVRPCKVELFEEQAGRIVVLTDEQCEVLRQAAIADHDPDIWLFVEFALNTAMRHSEILRTMFEDVDFEHNRLFIPKAKAGQREQPFTNRLAQILKRERSMRDTSDQDSWIFPSPRPNASSTGYRHRMNSPFRRVVKRSGLDPDTVTPHVLRHTAITKLVKANVDLPTIQKISGHKTIDMVLRYTHVHGEHIDEAVSKLDTAIAATRSDSNALELHKRKKT